ncbi:MAG: hypothetical protein P9L93_02135 [Candidatus Gorgyraea atricola]|nr:hypothetical protein [Candidatus Gorgyraea atricola]
MLILIRLLAIVIVVMGVIFLLNPKALKSYAAFWKQGKRLYVGAVINILFAVIFLSSASQCRISGVILVMGIMSLLKGIYLFILGPDKIKAKLDWWIQKPASTARIMAIIVIAMGALLIYSIG